MTAGNYAQARHFLAAASCIFQRFKTEKCGSAPSDSTGEEGPIADSRMAEQVRQTEADISRCWVKYCLALLTSSEEQLEERGEEEGAGVVVVARRRGNPRYSSLTHWTSQISNWPFLASSVRTMKRREQFSSSAKSTSRYPNSTTRWRNMHLNTY